MRKIVLAAALAATAGSWALAQGPPRDRPAAAQRTGAERRRVGRETVELKLQQRR